MKTGNFSRSITCVSSVFLIVVVTSYMFLPSSSLLAEEYFNRHFTWSYGGKQWTWDLPIPKSLYDAYKGVTVYDRTRNGPAGYGYLVTTRDSYVAQLADQLHKTASNEGYGTYDEVSFILAFVQSLPYTSDSVTTGYDEYPRFPVETLVDNGGDCEDTSILFATLVLILDYEIILVNPPKHIAVGVLGTNLQGSYYTWNGKTYYYCETTGNNWRIGGMPSDYRQVYANLYQIDQNSQYVLGQITFTQLASLIVILGAIITLVAGIAFYMRRRRVKETEMATSSTTLSTILPTDIAMKESPQPQINYCPYCGVIKEKDAVYCIKCGKKLE